MTFYFTSFIQLTLLALMLSLSNGLTSEDNATCGAFPDPHFTTWDNMYYDFQGGCDVVLIKKLADPGIPGDDSIEVHLATKPQGGYSAIVQVGVRINSDEYIYPSMPTMDSLPNPFGGFTTSSVKSISGNNVDEIDLGAGHFIRISWYTGSWNPGYTVQVHGNGAMFSNTEGMCGNWNIGGVTQRGGLPFPTTSTTDWAEHWEVQPGEKIFSTPYNDMCTGPDICGKDFPLPPPDSDSGGSFPCESRQGAERFSNAEESAEKLTMEEHMNSPRQKQNGGPMQGYNSGTMENFNSESMEGMQKFNGVTMENFNGESMEGMQKFNGGKTNYFTEIELFGQSCSCNDIPPEYPELRANCIYDVTVTGNRQYACQRAYTHPVIIKQPPTCPHHECVSVKPNLCEKNRGKCVKDCITSSKYTCNPKLCMEAKKTGNGGAKRNLKGTDGKNEKLKCACQIPVRKFPFLEAQLSDL